MCGGLPAARPTVAIREGAFQAASQERERERETDRGGDREAAAEAEGQTQAQRDLSRARRRCCWVRADALDPAGCPAAARRPHGAAAPVGLPAAPAAPRRQGGAGAARAQPPLLCQRERAGTGGRLCAGGEESTQLKNEDVQVWGVTRLLN